ncbi:WD40 repeat domain-containing protein [Candidatus Poribacteria bacterium]|nr:WD40 repeat domain-containing protein [Candidatus Poribacteria bacterium]
MKKVKKAFMIQVGLIFLLFIAQTCIHAQDYSQLNLPEGAKIRYGKGEISDIKFTPDGSMYAVGSSIGIFLYDVQSNKQVRFLQSNQDAIFTFSFANDGKAIIAAAEFGKMYIWDLQSVEDPNFVNIGKLYKRIQGIGYIWSSAITNDASILAVGTGSGSITLWNIQSGQQIASIKAHKKSVNGLAFSSNGKTLASSGEDNKIHLWDVPTQKRKFTLTDLFNAQTLAFSADGKSLVGGGFGGSVQSWNLDSRTKLMSYYGHTDRIRAVAYSPNNKIVASGSWDSTVRLWNANSGKQIGIISGYPLSVERMGFAPNGNTVAGTARGVINLWDSNTRSKSPVVIEKHSG